MFVDSIDVSVFVLFWLSLTNTETTDDSESETRRLVLMFDQPSIAEHREVEVSLFTTPDNYG